MAKQGVASRRLTPAGKRKFAARVGVVLDDDLCEYVEECWNG
jgi:hypothetical protein